MLKAPKGLKYWIETDNGTKIADNAPAWAVEEFNEYQEIMQKSGSPDENGIIRNL